MNCVQWLLSQTVSVSPYVDRTALWWKMLASEQRERGEARKIFKNKTFQIQHREDPSIDIINLILPRNCFFWAPQIYWEDAIVDLIPIFCLHWWPATESIHHSNKIQPTVFFTNIYCNFMQLNNRSLAQNSAFKVSLSTNNLINYSIKPKNAKMPKSGDPIDVIGP